MIKSLFLYLLGDKFIRARLNRTFNSLIIVDFFPKTNYLFRIKISIAFGTFINYSKYYIIKFTSQCLLFFRGSNIKFHIIKCLADIHLIFFFVIIICGSFIIFKDLSPNFFMLSKIFLRFSYSLEKKTMCYWRCFDMLLFHRLN